MQCPRCQHENRPQAKFCEECAGPLNGASTVTRPHADDLKAEVESLRRALTESVEQQTATAEILRVISSSPTDVQPVFDTIAASAVRLCDGRSGALYRIESGVVHLVAYVNPNPEAHEALRAAYPRPVAETDPAVQRIVIDAATIHLPDVETAPGLSDLFRARSRVLGHRSVVAVPMLRDGRVVGVLSVARAGPALSPRPFSDHEIALLQTFAAQAVIAIENVRLFNEKKESLEQQTATAEILRVIASSPTDLQPVFDAIVTSALRLCAGLYSSVVRYDGEILHLVAATTDGRCHRATPQSLPEAPWDPGRSRGPGHARPSDRPHSRHRD